jgi:hypothetical protein
MKRLPSQTYRSYVDAPLPEYVGNSACLNRISDSSSSSVALNHSCLREIRYPSELVAPPYQSFLSIGVGREKCRSPSSCVDACRENDRPDWIAITDRVAQFLDIDCRNGLSSGVAVGISVEGLAVAARRCDALFLHCGASAGRVDDICGDDNSGLTFAGINGLTGIVQSR